MDKSLLESLEGIIEKWEKTMVRVCRAGSRLNSGMLVLETALRKGTQELRLGDVIREEMSLEGVETRVEL